MYFSMILRIKILIFSFSLFHIGLFFSQLETYKFKAKLSNPNSTWHKIKLNSSVLDAVKSDFSDIRIFNVRKNDTIEVPFVLKTNYREYKKEIHQFKIYNQAQKSDEFYYTLSRKDEIEINEINLNFNSNNFEYIINLQGSYDGKEWFDVCKNYRLISIVNDQTNFKFTKLVFQASNYSFFRIIIPTEKDPKLFEAMYSKTKIIEESLDKNCHFKQKISQNKTNKQTIIDLNFDQRNIINKIHIPVLNKFDFYRNFSIYSADKVSDFNSLENCVNLYNGTLNSLDGQEIELGQSFVKNLRIIIENRDNQALDFDSISIFHYPIYLIGRFELEGEFFLCYGNSEANYPEYDLNYFKIASLKMQKN